jgi:hypothetical protein
MVSPRRWFRFGRPMPATVARARGILDRALTFAMSLERQGIGSDNAESSPENIGSDEVAELLGVTKRTVQRRAEALGGQRVSGGVPPDRFTRPTRKLTGLPWNHARSRRSCPLHRWLMDDAATADLTVPPSRHRWLAEQWEGPSLTRGWFGSVTHATGHRGQRLVSIHPRGQAHRGR